MDMTKLHKRSAQHINILLRQFSKITGLTKFLAGLMICTALIMSAQAQANVTLAWSPSSKSASE
jgi:cell division protein FtsL